MAGLLATAAPAQDFEHWCWEADELRTRVEEGVLIVFHDAALYNCCPDSFDYEGAIWLARRLEVTIPDAGQLHLPAVGETYNSGCIATQSIPETSIPEPQDSVSPTWGRIKSLFEPAP